MESLSGQYGVVSFQRTRFPAIPGGLLWGGHRAIRSFSGKSIQVSSNELASRGATEHRDGQRSLPLKTKIRQQMRRKRKGWKIVAPWSQGHVRCNCRCFVPPCRRINDANFGWRALRLLARRSPHFFTHGNTPITRLPDYLETHVKKLATEFQVDTLSPFLMFFAMFFN